MKHKIDWKKVSEGLGISEENTKECFNDGRFMGRYGEFVLAEKTNSNRAKSEGASYDVDSSDGLKKEVRSITKQISFASSKEVGYGRKVTEKGFKEKLDALDIYVGIDFRNMDEIEFIDISKEMVSEMISKGIMRKDKSVNSNKFFKFINN
jgi:hypothetical protein|tara:strand:+ start:755 stop:1207 length:453 start_codon:yes stop_codon:yes gene_type:complete